MNNQVRHAPSVADSQLKKNKTNISRYLQLSSRYESKPM